jgi:hypothetical protein
MAWFAKRTPKPHGDDRTAWMTATAQRLFAERGIETTISHGDTDLDVTLIAIDGQRYFLRNLLAATRDASPREAEQMARAHVESLAADATGHDLSRLSAEEVRQRIRTRLLSNRDLRPDEPRFDYARPFADGLVVALCIDLPHTVQTLGDSAVADLALDIDELCEQGQRNTASQVSSRPRRLSQTTSTALTTMAIRANSQRCQPELSARKLNAAPVL